MIGAWFFQYFWDLARLCYFWRYLLRTLKNINTSRIFMQIHILMNTAEEMQPEQRFVPPAKYYNEYSFSILFSVLFAIFCIMYLLRRMVRNWWYNWMQGDSTRRIKRKIWIEIFLYDASFLRKNLSNILKLGEVQTRYE